MKKKVQTLSKVTIVCSVAALAIFAVVSHVQSKTAASDSLEDSFARTVTMIATSDR